MLSHACQLGEGSKCQVKLFQSRIWYPHTKAQIMLDATTSWWLLESCSTRVPKKCAKSVIHSKKSTKKKCCFALEGRTSKSPRSNGITTFFQKWTMYNAFCMVFWDLLSLGVGDFGGFLVKKSVSKTWYTRKSEKKVVVSRGRCAHRCHHARTELLLFLKSCRCT